MDATQSLASRIAQARERAESFALRHQHLPQANHNNSMEARKKWTDQFEEKSVIIEQLERELGSTVDALNKKEAMKSTEASNGLDTLNLIDAIRKENTQLKLSLTNLIQKKNDLELMNMDLRKDIQEMKGELDELKREIHEYDVRWSRRENESSDLILSLESQLISLRAEISSPAKARHSSAPSEERMTGKEEDRLLDFARDEIQWLRDILE